MGKINFKTGVVLSVAGVCIGMFGANYHKMLIIFAGLIIATGGLVSVANRLYERIKEKRKEKLNALK